MARARLSAQEERIDRIAMALFDLARDDNIYVTLGLLAQRLAEEGLVRSIRNLVLRGKEERRVARQSLHRLRAAGKIRSIGRGWVLA